MHRNNLNGSIGESTPPPIIVQPGDESPSPGPIVQPGDESPSPGPIIRRVDESPLPGPIIRRVDESPFPGPIVRRFGESPYSGCIIRRVDESSLPGPIVRRVDESPYSEIIMRPYNELPPPAMIMPPENRNDADRSDSDIRYIIDKNYSRHSHNIQDPNNYDEVIQIIDDDPPDHHHNHQRRRNRRNNDRGTACASIMDYQYEDVASGLCDPRRVRNIKDMFKYATDLSDGVPMAQGIDNMTFDEERRKFLSTVLSTMTVNVQEELNNSMNILYDDNKPLNEHECAFDVIAEYVDNIDYANDFEKLGGFHIFLPCFRSEHPTIRMKTAELISTLVQHNAYCQDKFMENPAYLTTVMSMVEADPNEEVRIKCLAAISSLIRHNVTVFWKFIENGGKDLIINALKAPIDKLQIKAVFIICSTCHMGNDVAEMYVDNGVVEIISSIIMSMEKKFETQHHELFLSTLNQLIRMSPVRVKEICSSVEDFKLALTSLRDSYPNEVKHQDEKDQILWLMETLTL